MFGMFGMFVFGKFGMFGMLGLGENSGNPKLLDPWDPWLSEKEDPKKQRQFRIQDGILIQIPTQLSLSLYIYIIYIYVPESCSDVEETLPFQLVETGNCHVFGTKMTGIHVVARTQMMLHPLFDHTY